MSNFADEIAETLDGFLITNGFALFEHEGGEKESFCDETFGYKSSIHPFEIWLTQDRYIQDVDLARCDTKGEYCRFHIETIAALICKHNMDDCLDLCSASQFLNKYFNRICDLFADEAIDETKEQLRQLRKEYARTKFPKLFDDRKNDY